jgi:hypothetical protein
MLAIVIIEGVALLFLGLLVVGVLRSHAEILRTLHEMGEGVEADRSQRPRAAAPRGDNDGPTGGPGYDLHGQTLDDEAIEIGLVGAPADTLLAFLSATCYTCEPFWAALASGVDVGNNARVIAVVQDGDSRARLRKLAGSELLVVASDAAWTDYDVPGSPHFVYVDGPSGQVIGEGTASTWEQVRDLLEQATDARPSTTQANASDRDPAHRDPAHRDNAGRIDLELLTAGIGPGHPSLYPDLEPSRPDTSPPS